MPVKTMISTKAVTATAPIIIGKIYIGLNFLFFIKRFNYIEEELGTRGKKVTESDLQEMDSIWNEAKKTIK